MSEKHETAEIFDGLEFNAEKEIYWDALDISEESVLTIVRPSDIATIAEDTLRVPSENQLESDEGSNKRKSDFIDEEDCDIKAMRFGSLGRIVQNSVAASSFAPEPVARAEPSVVSHESSIELRRSIIAKFNGYLNFGDMNGIAKSIREHFHDACTLVTPDLNEPVVGKANVMIFISLLHEALPDSVWRLQSTKVEGSQVKCVFKFSGTMVISQPLHTFYHQVREYVHKHMHGTSYRTQEIETQTIQNDVADCVRLSHPSSSRTSRTPSLTGRASFFNNNEALKSMASIEKQVLKFGAIYKYRTCDYEFDENNRIVKIIAMDINPDAAV